MSVDGSTTPKHVAIIMDGNGRWAKARGLPRVEGHRAGAKNVRPIVETSLKEGVRYLTLFAFSTENWQRPKEEVSALMLLLRRYLSSELSKLIKNNIRLRAMGDLNKLPDSLVSALRGAEEQSKNCDGLDLILAISYGGRDEIVKASQKIAKQVQQGELEVSNITEEAISNSLYLPEVPFPDMLIRTSGECRISNFLLWQLAYAEIIVSQKCWPEFDQVEYKRCLEEFSTRYRRFGLTQEQMDDKAIKEG